MDENYVAYKLEVDEVGLKEKRSIEGIPGRAINDIKQKIDKTSKNSGWVIFKKNGNQYEPCELYEP